MITEEQALEIAAGDKQAAAFLLAFQSRAHLVDDLEDRDQEITDCDLIAEEVDWLLMVAGNEFFQAHKASLVPLMISGLVAWGDSNRWRRNVDATKRRASDVLKGFYHEVAYWVAFLTGGLEHMQKMTNKYRSYDFEQESK